MKQLHELEEQLDDEKKGRSVAQIASKKYHSEISELEALLDSESKGKDDAMRSLKKTQVCHLVHLFNAFYSISFAVH